MEKNKLNKIRTNHAKWVLSNRKEGERADLTGADLEGAYLTGANLRGAYLGEALIKG